MNATCFFVDARAVQHGLHIVLVLDNALSFLTRAVSNTTLPQVRGVKEKECNIDTYIFDCNM